MVLGSGQAHESVESPPWRTGVVALNEHRFGCVGSGAVRHLFVSSTGFDFQETFSPVYLSQVRVKNTGVPKSPETGPLISPPTGDKLA